MSVKVKKSRVFSAKYSPIQPERPRPYSGVSTQAFHRQELIENTYSSHTAQPTRALSARPTHTGRWVSSGFEAEKEGPVRVVKPSKKKQQMSEQIQCLKQTINKLVQELSQERGKVQMMRRKTNKYSKMLSVEFENEQQWGSQAVSNHLVTGIKNMYDQLKQKHQHKCKEYDELLASSLASNYLEAHTYIRALELNNHELKRKLETHQNQQGGLLVSNQSQNQASTFLVAQLKVLTQKQSQKLDHMESLYKRTRDSLRDNEKKIAFLEKLIIEKDNHIHSLQLKNKDLSKENTKFKKELASINQQLADLQSKYEEYKDFSVGQQKELREKHQLQVQSLTQQKDRTIFSLQKNNNYLQELVGELRRNNTQLNSQIQNLKEQRSIVKLNQKPAHDPITTKQAFPVIPKDSNSPSNKCQDSQGNRIPQKADRKHFAQSRKMRKVQQSDVIEIAELIRYKMIGQGITQESLKAMFDYDPTRGQEDPEWSKVYITMKEIMGLLINSPFQLNNQDSILLARYLVEDVQEEYVYCDQLNENNRIIVTSIIHALLQSLGAPIVEPAQVDQELQLIMGHYAENLQNALKSLEPSGIISQQKFSSVLRSLGIEASQSTETYLIAKMSLHSQSIKKLPYNVLF